MKQKILYTILALAACGGLMGCSDDPIVDNPSGETVIYWLRVTNAGLTGTETVEGVVNEQAKTVTFDVPAETNIEEIKFRSKLSLNAQLDKESYDFSNLEAPVTVVNVENTSTYTVKFNLVATSECPIMERVGVRLPDGTEHDGYVSMVDSTIYLGAEGFDEVVLTEVVSLPHRANKIYSNIENNVVKRDPKGSVKLEFMGKTQEYRFSFSAIPVFGADFNKATVWNYSADGGNQSPDWVSDNTRSADYDGKEMLVVSREGGVNPYVLTVDAIKSGNPSGRTLNMDGVSSGTFLLSAGRLAQGHIYICNLSVGIKESEPFKIYHWSNSSAPCETVFTLDGTGDTEADKTFAAKRFGDNMSVDIDENGNGYMFFVTQDGTMIMRLDVTGFTTISNPTYVAPPTAASYYASVNRVVGTTNEYVYTSSQAPIILMDKDGKQIGNTIPAEVVPARCCDARVIVYDNERYLIATASRWGSWVKNEQIPTLYVYSLAEGINTAQAFDKLIEAEDKSPLFELEMGGSYGSAPAANTGWGIVNGNLSVMGAATRAGYVLVEFPEREE
ncbi:MAG: DUF4623 domain-containing protein [Muribaculaceae bacterium]|nr:DUF4623 domain-containing protein [Muribaculaceae bacterium]